ncbi:HalOD1 output domain-containing protein [Halomarina salina]|uniref:HalOD1 output domain-containing protein n=1 Tax=Halomarina salina TaxID=1872699 RepID=A0ABD5RRQ7_9EURY|nr:HalOD1 output domain-containing protein [Halomarina salina]
MNSCRNDGTQTEGWTYEVGPDEPYSVAVVSAVADAAGVDPLELPELLCDAVAVDAMESMFSDRRPATVGTVQLSFSFCGYSVLVSAGTVELFERESRGE